MMQQFKPLSLEDRELFLNYLDDYPFETYEYSFLTLYMWRNYFQAEYALVDNALVIKKYKENEGACFMEPLGYTSETLPHIVENLLWMRKKDAMFTSLFKVIEEPFVSKLKELYGKKLICSANRNYADYIYLTSDLISLSGKKLQKRKNQYRQFVKNYNYCIKDLHEEGVKEDCLSFARKWYEKSFSKTKEMFYELEGLKEIFEHLAEFSPLGMAVYVDGRIVGFTMGEKLNSSLATVHVEKGDINFKGIYAFINKTFAEKYLKDTLYINRQEDMGIPGLRRAKQSYDPYKLVKKYTADII